MVTVKEPQCLEVVYVLVVLSLGRFSVTEATVSVNINELTTVGKTVKIVCTVTEEKFVGWFDLEGNEVTARVVPGQLPRDKYYVDIKGDDYTLVVQNVAVEDGGNYTCKGEEETKISTLYVEFFVTEFPKNQDLFVGQTQIIRCSADGYPKPRFVWFKEFISIDFDDPRLTLLSNGSLLIKGVHQLDSGSYACQISQLGDIERTREETKYIDVTVYGPPRINLEKSSRELHSYIGNPISVVIKCKWWGFPVPEVGITKDGQGLPDEDVEKSDGFIEATVNTNNDADFGTYVCDARNSLGSATHNVMVRKAGPPSYPRNITFTTTCDHLTVAWAEPASDGGLPIKRYTVTLSDVNQIIDTVYVTVGTNRFTFTNQDGVQPRTFYSISMQAANELNEGDKGEGNITSAYCPPSGVFHITNNVTSLNTTSFILTWTRPPRDGGDADLTYDVEYSKRNPQGMFVHWTSRKGIGELALNVSGLTGKSEYEFRVFASNIAGRKREPAIKRFDVHLPSIQVIPKPGETGQPDLVYDMHVNCSSLYMQVDFALRSSYLDFETFRFVNESCGSHSATSAHVLLKTPLNSCGTTSKHRGDTVTYYNTVVARTKDASKVYIVEFPFSCAYGKMEVIGVPSFQPRKKITFIEEGRGNFSFEMGLFRNGEYKSSYEISEYPVSISPTSKLYCQAKLDTSDSELILLADTCVATPSVDPFHRIKYTFIENGCPVDNETEYNYTVSETQRFQLSPFRWTQNYTIVYLHCKVLVCHKDKTTRCYKGCLSSHLRHGRSATKEEYLQVTLGPIMFHEPKQPSSEVLHEGTVHHSSKTIDSRAPLWPVIIICGTVIGVGLVLYGIVHIVYHRSSKLLHRGHVSLPRPSEEIELFTSETV